MELKQSESNPAVSLIIEIGLMLVIFSSILLHGGVADIYWYPTAMLVVILFCASIFFREKKLLPTPKKVGLEIFFLLLAGLMVVSAAFSSHRWMSINALERLFVLVLFFYLMLWHFSTRQREKALLWGLFGFPALICLVGMMFYLSKKPGLFPFIAQSKSIQTTFVNHNNFAGLTILAFFLGLGLVMGQRLDKNEFKTEMLGRLAILAIPLVALLLGLLLSMSRSGWIAFLVSGIGFGLWLGFGKKGKKKYLALFLAVASLVSILGLLLGRQQLKERIATINDFLKDPSSGLTLMGRKMIWKSTLAMIKDHPLLGIGPGNYWLEYPHYRSPGDFFGEYHAHNDFLQITAEGGIGSSVLVLVLFAGAFSIWRKNYNHGMSRFNRRVSIGILMGMLGFIFQDQFDFHFYIPGLDYYFLALAAVLLKPRGEKPND